MSGQGYIKQESSKRCELCGKLEETRPYGPHGEDVCFHCGMKNEKACIRAFKGYVLGEHS